MTRTKYKILRLKQGFWLFYHWTVHDIW